MKKLVIFDLDGTLLNTIADLAQATNYALEVLGYPTHATPAYQKMVGNGINKLFERALPEEGRSLENVLAVREHFLPYYEKHKMDKTAPYPGIVSLLQKLQQQGKLLAVASNKYQDAAVLLTHHYFPTIKFDIILGERQGVMAKPDPQIIYDIIDETKVDKKDILYVGDSSVDMQTAKAANVDVCVVTWGFSPRVDLEAYSPNYCVEEALDILNIVSL